MLAPFGGNLEGVRAASLAYFGKEPLRLTPRPSGAPGRAAAIAGSAQARVVRRQRRARARDRVLDRVAARGLSVREADDAAAKREPVPQARLGFPALAARTPPRKRSPPKSQGQGHQALDRRAPATRNSSLSRRTASRGSGRSCRRQSSSSTMRRGEIRARVGSADYDDASRDGAVDMSRSPRSPGSALKPFIYALAFEQGLAHPETRAVRPADALRGLRAGEFQSRLRRRGDGAQGAAGCRSTSRRSSSCPTSARPLFLARLHSAGAEIALPKDTPVGLAIGLGGLGITLTDIARLYAGFARGGEARPLIEWLDGRPPVDRCAPGDRSRRGVLCRGHPARRAAARQCAERPDRLQDRHVLRLPRCAGDRLRPARRRWRSGSAAPTMAQRRA